MTWQLAGVVEICCPVNNPPLRINASVKRTRAVTLREPKLHFCAILDRGIYSVLNERADMVTDCFNDT